MGCVNCQKPKVAESLKALSLPGNIMELAEKRASFCDRCDNLTRDLFCRAKVTGQRYIPSVVKNPGEHCPLRLW